MKIKKKITQNCWWFQRYVINMVRSSFFFALLLCSSIAMLFSANVREDPNEWKKKKKDWSWMKKKHKPVCYLLFSMHFAELQCWNENGNARRLRYQFVVLFISIYICGDFFCCCCCSILFLLLLLLFCTF